MEGFINLHRTLLDSMIFSSQTGLKIWIWLLLKASFKKRYVSLKIGKGETIVTIERGQLLFGRYKAEEELCIDGSTVYKWIKKLEENGMILIQSNNQYSIITICNYDTYQSGNTNEEQPMNNQRATNEQPMNSRRTTNEQQANTYNKDNKVNKVNKDNKVNKEDGEKQKLVFPYNSKKFMLLWNELVKMPKWRKKPFSALQLTLNKLSEFDEDFVIELIENAITGNYQGIIFSNTKEKYEQFKQQKYGGENVRNNAKKQGVSREELAEVFFEHFQNRDNSVE
jgi:hypothetical protein